MPDGFRIPDQREGSLLDVLFRLGSEKKLSDLREQARHWQRRLATEVYFFDHAPGDLLEIASSFAAFVDGFYDPPAPS